MFGDSHTLDGVNYGCCPVPKTHRRLVEAHLLWHQCLANYQEPEAFRANLNALIQALRNVTWVLQSEKREIADFDDWYAAKQERLRAHRVSKWLIEARNRIVKKGELDASSSAKIRLVTWQNRVLAELVVPPDFPSSLILSNLCLVGLASNVGISLTNLKNATVFIERSWTVADLDDLEILEALAGVYALLSEIVLDAHEHMQTFGCISQEPQHPHFVSRYHRTGILECMALGAAHRTDLFELGSGQELVLRRTSSPFDPELAAARYGFSAEETVADWESLDPLIVAEKCLYRAKRILQKDKSHRRIVMIRDGTGQWRLLTLSAANRAEKYLLMQMVARFVESVGADAIIDISEMWVVPKDVADKLGDPDLYDKAPGRREELYLFIATREGKTRSYYTPFSRGPFGGIKLSETIRKDEKHWPSYMEPVIDVWRRQGVVLGPEGKRIRRLWEPDVLAGCFCGGSKRFAECCKPVLDQFEMKQIEKSFHAAMQNEDLILAELNARAALAQYVIWIRQHTAQMMHTGGEAYQLFVDIDLEALEAHIKRLAVVLQANQHSDDLLPRLQTIRRIVGVPELSVRLVAIGALWLVENGSEAGAVEELNALGDMERINDPLALSLAARLLDIPQKKQQLYFEKAIGAARSGEERTSIKLDLIRNLLRADDKDGARPVVESLIATSDAANADAHTKAEIYFYRWTISQDEGDWKLALENMASLTNEETHLATMLIEHGDLEEAENVLLKCTKGRELTVELLSIDICLRANRIAEAHKLLFDIDGERLTPEFLFPYAAAYAHVALAHEDLAMKRQAAEKLTSVLPAGRETTSLVNSFLKALAETEPASRSVLARLRDFLPSHL